MGRARRKVLGERAAGRGGAQKGSGSRADGKEEGRWSMREPRGGHRGEEGELGGGEVERGEARGVNWNGVG